MDTAVGRAGQESGTSCADESSERVKVQQQGLRKSKWSSCRNLPRHVTTVDSVLIPSGPVYVLSSTV